MTNATAPRTVTSIDLFSGAGGLSTGLRQAKLQVVAAVERDFEATITYRMNHAATSVIHADIRAVTGPALLKRAGLPPGTLDLLTACPPCQSFSTLRTRRAKKRTTVSDESRTLILEVLRLVRSIRPRALLLENVPGLIKDSNFTTFCTGLGAAGYDWEYRILDAQMYGVPQRRKRLVLLAVRAPLNIEENWWAPDNSTTKRTVRDAIGHLRTPGSTGDILHDLSEVRSDRILARIRAIPKDGGSRHELPKNHILACHRQSDGYSDVYGRMSWDKVSPTITSGCHNPSKGRFLHPTEDRAITLREAALLQTFPQDYQFALLHGKEHCARQIGNAFPPALIVPIASRLRARLERVEATS